MLKQDRQIAEILVEFLRTNRAFSLRRQRVTQHAEDSLVPVS